MSKNTKFIKSIYDDISLDKVYKQQRENETSILQAIAMLILSFLVLDNVMKLKEEEKKTNKAELFLLINSIFILDKNISKKTLETLLIDTTKKVYKYYGGKELTKKQLRDIVKVSFKGKTFSKRIWDNSNKVSKLLKKDIDKFLKGKISVNDIKNHISKHFKVNKYNINRLVNTEISRVINDATILYCRENNLRVRYVAELDNKTCHDCKDYDGMTCKVSEIPFELPQHANCRCYWEPIIE